MFGRRSAPALHQLDRAVVCGLVHERGERARAATHTHPWERDHAVWAAVVEALGEARQGRRRAPTADAPPRWLLPLVRDRLAAAAERRSESDSFTTIRALERLGLVDLAVDEAYVLAVVAVDGDHRAPRPADLLRADPELREAVVWRLFEVEGGGEISLANVDKYSQPQNGWREAFCDLTAEGTLPRARVLTAALDALGRDFSAYRAGWYARLYDALAPTPAERAAHQDRYRRLLRSEVTATVTLAVTGLRAVSQAAGLDDAATVPALLPALLVPVKGTAVATVRLLADIADRTPALAAPVAETTATALGHPHADVQRAAVRLLTRLDAGHLVDAAADGLEPSVLADLGRPVPPTGPAAAPVDAPPVPSPAPVAAGRTDALDRFAALLEDAGDPLELELVLAGLAASDDPALLRPLRTRATGLLDRGPGEWLSGGWLAGHLARLVLLSTGEHPAALDPGGTSSTRFLVRRLDEMAGVLTGQTPPRSLLATPGHPAGWLDAAVLVDRLADGGRPIGRHDLVAALLRLHPDGRPAALRDSARLTGQLPDHVLGPLRHALGAPPPAAALAPGADVGCWVAASRARTPLGDDDWLLGQGIDGAGRSRALSASLTLLPEHHSWTDARGVHPVTHWSWTVQVAHPAPNLPADEPTATVGWGRRPDHTLPTDAVGFTGWQALLWPHDAERFLVDAVHPVLQRATGDEVEHSAARVLDALLGHPGRLGPLSAVTLAAGLAAAGADERARAVDAVLHLTGAGRLTAAQLGQGLADLAPAVTVPRWAGPLRDIAAADPAGRRLVIDALSAALPGFAPAGRGLHALLGLLRDELLRAQAPTPAELRPWLGQLAGSSRAATLARSLLG